MKNYSEFYYSSVSMDMHYSEVRINRDLPRYGYREMDSCEAVEACISHRATTLESIIFGY